MLVRDPERLRAAMIERQLSYRQLARLAEVSPSFLTHLVPGRSGKPRKRSCSPQTAARIERALGQPAGALFEHRRASDPSTGDLPIVREDPITAPLPLSSPRVSTSSTHSRHEGVRR